MFFYGESCDERGTSFLSEEPTVPSLLFLPAREETESTKTTSRENMEQKSGEPQDQNPHLLASLRVRPLLSPVHPSPAAPSCPAPAAVDRAREDLPSPHGAAAPWWKAAGAAAVAAAPAAGLPAATWKDRAGVVPPRARTAVLPIRRLRRAVMSLILDAAATPPPQVLMRNWGRGGFWDVRN